MKLLTLVILTVVAGLGVVGCGSQDTQSTPAAPTAPAAGSPTVEAAPDAGAQAANRARMTWFFIDGCDDARKIRWKLFDADDDFRTTFPATGVWTIQSGGTSTRTITCTQGHPICFGATVDLPARYGPTQWGVGINGQFGARKGACFRCNNYTIGGKLICRFRKSGVAASGDAEGLETFEEIE